MKPAGRLTVAFGVALALHAGALVAAGSWLPARPASPPRLVSFVVTDGTPDDPPVAAWRLRASGPMASRPATLRVVLTPPGGGPPEVRELPVAAVPGGLAGGGEAALALPGGAAGPWVAEAVLVAGGEPAGRPGGSASAGFWVDDGRVGDLAVEGLDAGGTVAAAGGAVRVTWERRNRGAGWLRGVGVDAVRLEASGEAVAASEARGFPPLPPGGASTHSRVLSLPGAFSGVATLSVEVDASRRLPEPHGPENRAELPLLVEPSPFPDLAAVRLDVGEAATLRRPRPAARAVPVLAGSPVPVRLAVENLSPAAAAPRLDAVYLSLDGVLDPGDARLVQWGGTAPLAGRAADTGVGEVIVPKAWAGEGETPARAFLIGVVDAGGAVDEGDPARRRNNAVAVEIAVRRPAPEPEDTPLGADDAEPRVTLAWISHEAFEELRARKRRTLQPSVQASAVPVPAAPARDATAPPTPPRPPSPSAEEPVEEAAPEAAPPPLAGDPAAAGEELPAPGPADAPDPRIVAENEPEAPRSADPAAEATPASPPSPPPAPEGPPTPTSADPSRSAADATADADELRPGRVEVGPGLRIDVARPRVDPVAVLSTVVRPPRVSVTFDTDGTVLLAQILRSAGSNAVDAPILRSLYRWRASGERLEKWDGPRSFEFTFLFNR